jgi:hypothetical protein
MKWVHAAPSAVPRIASSLATKPPTLNNNKVIIFAFYFVWNFVSQPITGKTKTVGIPQQSSKKKIWTLVRESVILYGFRKWRTEYFTIWNLYEIPLSYSPFEDHNKEYTILKWNKTHAKLNTTVLYFNSFGHIRWLCLTKHIFISF